MYLCSVRMNLFLIYWEASESSVHRFLIYLEANFSICHVNENFSKKRYGQYQAHCITTDQYLAMGSISTRNHSHLLWRSRLSSALRTALACSVVGATTLYSPAIVRHQIKFPTFSYMTAVLIMGDSTLGDSVKGAACALYGTALGLLPAMLSLYMLHPKDISSTTTAIAVAISAFVVAVFDSTALITKRIALGQIVIVYVTAFKEAGHGRPVLHPMPVAASTAVGAVASVLALVFPYPRLAYYQTSKKRELYTEIALERLRLCVNGICAGSSACVATWASRAKSLTAISTKLLRNITRIQGSLQWERSLFKFLPLHSTEKWETLQAIEMPLKGMEMALASTTSSPRKIPDQKFKDDLISQTKQISIKLRQGTEIPDKSLKDVIPQNLQDLPLLFFLFCMKLLCNAGQSIPSPSSLQENKFIPTSDDTLNLYNSTKRRSFMGFWPVKVSIERLVVALKCSLSLSLAVLLGVLFSSENGYWSGLTVAIAFTPSGDATFKSASVRAHGTALGSVYGVLGSFVSQNVMEVRLLFLVPWIVFTSFLHHSRMYGQVGGFAATISAMIILGRRNYGSPMIFAVQRLTETYIGLCCAVFFELVLQPKRASTIARARLSKSLEMVRECLESVASPVELKEKEMKLRKQVTELRKFVTEAELEPNFWFLPFPTACYNEIHGALANMVDLLLFLVRSMELLVEESHGTNENIRGDMKHFGNLIVSSVKCFEDAIQIKSLARSETSSIDIETGRVLRHCGHEYSSVDEEECNNIVDSFLRLAKEVMGKRDEDVSRDSKSQVVLCLATFGFCIEGLMREVKEMEKGIIELVQCENPSCHIDLHEIPCKLHENSK